MNDLLQLAVFFLVSIKSLLKLSHKFLKVSTVFIGGVSCFTDAKQFLYFLDLLLEFVVFLVQELTLILEVLNFSVSSLLIESNFHSVEVLAALI